jgi:hypothetical protein
MIERGFGMSPRENSVKQLSELYNVVTGVALSLAITKLIDPSSASNPIRGEFVLTFLAFLVVIVPFHQGAVRHLYATYVEQGGSSRIKDGALAIDFLLLFFQACIFVALGILIVNLPQFTNALMILLIVDCAWGLLAMLAFTGARAQWTETKWAIINFITFLLMFTLSKFGPPLLGGWNSEMQTLVFLLSLARTIADYSTSWSFYYPARVRSSSIDLGRRSDHPD